MTLGEKLRELRGKKSVGAKELCKKLRFSKGYISNIESGCIFPSPKRLKILADYFGFSVDELLDGVERDEKAAIFNPRKTSNSSMDKVDEFMERVLEGKRTKRRDDEVPTPENLEKYKKRLEKVLEADIDSCIFSSMARTLYLG